MYSVDEELRPRSCGVILPFSAMIAARWILFSSSRTFPGQPCDSMTWSALRSENEILLLLYRLPLKKGFGEQESISLAITQRWYCNVDYIQSIVQVFSESSLSHRLREVNVGCGQNSGVYGNQGSAADPFDFDVPAESAGASPAGLRTILRFRRETVFRPGPSRRDPVSAREHP